MSERIDSSYEGMLRRCRDDREKLRTENARLREALRECRKLSGMVNGAVLYGGDYITKIVNKALSDE